MPERLRRLERVEVDHPIDFVTTCTHDRRPLLANSTVQDAFVAFAKIAAEHQIHVGRYVIMPDHLHLFVKFSQLESDLSGWIKSLKNSLSKALRQSGSDAPHWQKGFFDHVLRSGESYTEKWYYVVHNPVRQGLVTEWRDWPWQGEVHTLRH